MEQVEPCPDVPHDLLPHLGLDPQLGVGVGARRLRVALRPPPAQLLPQRGGPPGLHWGIGLPQRRPRRGRRIAPLAAAAHGPFLGQDHQAGVQQRPQVMLAFACVPPSSRANSAALIGAAVNSDSIRSRSGCASARARLTEGAVRPVWPGQA